MTPSASTGKHLAVIGGGIVGATIAVELGRRGHRVTLVDPAEPGGQHAASYGNGGWLSPSLVVPVALPGLWRKVPGYLMDPTGPLTIGWRHLPRLAPWLLRFVLSGATLRRVEKTARALQPLVADCHLRHDALAIEAGVGDLIEKNGQIQVYRSRKDFEKEHVAWHLRRLAGAGWTEIGAEELRRMEPHLDPRYTFGVAMAGYNCISPGRYVAALVRLAEQFGATHRTARASGFRTEDGRITAVVTDGGDIACDSAIVCAGIHSKDLARAAGDRVMLEAEGGYHVQFEGLDRLPGNRVLLMDGKMATTPSRFGLRVTGHVELSSTQAPPDWRRAEILRDFALAAHGYQAADFKATFWKGLRPSTPDGLPVIGRASRLANLVYAFGHGHIGVASSPNTAQAVADLVDGRAPSFDLLPFSSKRFQ